MKALFILTLALVTTLVSANTVETVFQKDSELPVILQTQIIKQMTKDIPCLEAYSMSEVKTEVKIDRIDQGITDYYYTTTINFTYFWDRYHPSHGTITVKSEQIDFYCHDHCNFRIAEMLTSEFTCEN
jgi:hypothetical protein